MSNKKTLLKENTIRRFMKLASIEPLAETFVDKLKEEEKEPLAEEETEEEVVGEETQEKGQKALKEVAPPTDSTERYEGSGLAMDRDDDLGGLGDLEDLGEPEELDEPAAACETEALADLLSKVGDAVEVWADEHGVDVSVDVDTEGEGEEDLGLEPELEGPMSDLGLPPEEEELPPEEDLLEKLTHRIAYRMLQEREKAARQQVKENKIDAISDVIVERIFNSAKK